MTRDDSASTAGGNARRQAALDALAIIAVECRVVREALDAGADPATAVATIRQAAYLLALGVGGLDACARITHINGVLDPRYLPPHGEQ